MRYIDYFQFQYDTQQVVKITLGGDGVRSHAVTDTWVGIRIYNIGVAIPINGLVSFGYFFFF